MFSTGPNYNKLKTNLRLAINRLKLLEKKKTELALKARKEIADYIATGKTERAKIRVEHIIREDYLVEAMEVTEMYCDLILARFGLISQMKDLDEGLAEAISSLIWVSIRLQTDVAELKIIADILGQKYGKPYAQACREQQVATISEKLMHKLSVQAPPKLLVEKYLIEIAKNYNVEYEPDPQVMREGEWADSTLINLDDNQGAGGGPGGEIPPGPTGFIGYPQQPTMPQQPFSYPSEQKNPNAAMELNLPNVPGQTSYPSPPSGGQGYPIPPAGAFNYPQPPPADSQADPLPPKNYPPGAPGGGSTNWEDMLGLDNSPPPPYTSIDYNKPPSALNARPFPPDVAAPNPPDNKPTPSPRSKFNEEGSSGFVLPDLPSVPDFPSVPHTPEHRGSSAPPADETQEDIDFDDLTKRFEELKKKK